MAESNPKIVLAGGGHAHLGVLSHILHNGKGVADYVMVSDAPRTAYSGMLPSWMAGLVAYDSLFIDSEKLALTAGVPFVKGKVAGLDADKRQITLASGERLNFDILSLATGGENDSAPFAALGERLLTVRPIEDFIQRWSAAMGAAQAAGHLRLLVIGGGAGGVELALAASAAASRARIASTIGVVIDQDRLLPGHAPRVQRRAALLLNEKGIDVHNGRAVGADGGVMLSNGQFFPADWVIAATGSRAPAWLAQSGLSTDARGFVRIGADLRSVSHPYIFAAGDIIQRVDRPLPRSGVHAVKAGPVLATNIIASVNGAAMQSYDPPEKTLYLLASGDRRAILSYGRFAGFGRVFWWLKRLIDDGFVHHYARLVSRK